MYIFRPVVIFFLLSSVAHAIHFSQLHGVEEILKEDQRHLSPIYPQALLESNWLKRFRFYGPYSDKKTPKYTPIKSETDYPQSDLARLIQYFFPSPDGNTLARNRLQSFAPHILSLQDLGKVFLSTRQAPDETTVLNALNRYIDKTKTHNMYSSDVRRLSKVLFKAFHTTSPEDALTAQYAFMAYALLRCETKEDLLVFLTSAGISKDRPFECEEEELAWLAKSFTKEDYFATRRTVTFEAKDESGTESDPDEQDESSNIPYISKTNARRLIQSPEKMFLIGAGARRYEKFPLLIHYGDAEFEGNVFSDCAEAALYGLINHLLYNPASNTLDIAKLPATALPCLQEFYIQANADPSQLASLRPQWSRMLCNLENPAINYQTIDQTGRYELSSSLKNLATVLEHLFGFECSPSHSLKERWATILKHFYYDESNTFSLDSDTDEGTLANGDLEICVDERPHLTLSSIDFHTKLVSHKKQDSWVQRAAPIIMGELLQERENFASLFLCSLYGDEHALAEFLASPVTQKEQETFLSRFRTLGFLYSLETNNGKLKFLDMILRHSHISIRRLENKAMTSFMGTLMRLNFNDPENIYSINALLQQNASQKKSIIIQTLKSKLLEIAKTKPIAQFCLPYMIDDMEVKDIKEFDLTQLSMSNQQDVSFMYFAFVFLVSGQIKYKDSLNFQEISEWSDSSSESSSTSPDSSSSEEEIFFTIEQKEGIRYIFNALNSHYLTGTKNEQENVVELLSVYCMTLINRNELYHGYELYHISLDLLNQVLSYDASLFTSELDEIEESLDGLFASSPHVDLDKLKEVFLKYGEVVSAIPDHTLADDMFSTLLEVSKSFESNELSEMLREFLNRYPDLAGRKIRTCDENKKQETLSDFLANKGWTT